MPFEDIGAVERLLCRRPGPRAEAAHHGALVMSQRVAVLVVFSRETFNMVIARIDGALLGAFVLVREHMGLEVFENLAAVGMGACALYGGI